MDNAPFKSDYCSNFGYDKIEWYVDSRVRLGRKPGFDFNDKMFFYVLTVYLLELKSVFLRKTNGSKTCWNPISLETLKDRHSHHCGRMDNFVSIIASLCQHKA